LADGAKFMGKSHSDSKVQKLEQPMQGSHPEGTDVSALNHIFGVHATIQADRGLFLEETWRLHPGIAFNHNGITLAAEQPATGSLRANCRSSAAESKFVRLSSDQPHTP
jgi:hypothetical protein